MSADFLICKNCLPRWIIIKITDIHSAIRHLKDNSETKLLVFVYNVEPAAKSFILSLGADACLTRPCLQEELQDTITGLVSPNGSDTISIAKSGEIGTPLNTQSIADKTKLEGLKILVAEDNPINTKLLLTVLKESGAECLHASNGEEAISIYKDNNINLVLMDKQMPVVSGFEAAKQIREIEGTKTPVPIIGLTAATTPEELNEFMASGIDDILTKPIATEELIHEIVYWVNHYNNLKDTYSDSDKDTSRVKDPDSLKYDIMNFDSLGMNKELSSSLLSMLIDELPATTSHLEEAYSKNDLASLREQLHKLLGGLSYCDLPELLHKTKLLKASVEQQSDSLNNDFTTLIAEINNTLTSFTDPKKPRSGSSITQEANNNSEDI
jgi:two-component system sensor histidine kinase BarA